MKLNAEQINKIKEIAEEYDFDYAAIGFRSQDVPFALGSIAHVSHIWDNGDDTGEDLPGICVCSVKLVDRNPDYYGEHCAVIAGNAYEYGEDEGEYIIRDPEVIAIIA